MAKFKISMEIKGKLPSVKNQVGSILETVAQSARDEWVRMARKTLHSTAKSYIDGIGEPVRKGGTVTISLNGVFPNMLENGSASFDLKKSLLRSPKAKTSKGGGKYITVPFGLKSPGRGSEPPGVPGPIYRQALKLKFGQSFQLPKKYESWGIRSKLSADLNRWSHYTWKSSPFQGITRVQRFPGLVKLGLPREKLGKLMTFRRVSKKSDPSSWIHPGFKNMDLMTKVSNKISEIFPKILDQVNSAM